jgi:hypothetical protein
VFDLDDVQFAVPTYRRAATLATKTLPELARLGVAAEQVTVFLSDPEERGDYLDALALARVPGGWTIRFAAGALGVGANRNLIHHHWPEGQRVVSIDDDVKQVLIKRNDQLIEPIEPYEFEESVAHAFECAGVGLWGVHPVPNAYFQRFKVSQDLRYIAAGLYGFTTRADPALDVDLEDKEDFERSIRWYLADGAVTRLNWIGLKTAGYHGAGGMQVTRTPERVDWSAREIVRRWPDLASLNLKKTSGWAEVRLRDRRPLGQASL